MRGIVYTGEKAELVERLEVREPGPTEVKVRVVAAGLCHSDVSVIDGTIPWPAPAVLGHEGAGVVEAVGSAVTNVRPGDHVVLTTLANCGMCKWCNTGRPTWCRASMGNPSQTFTLDGRPAWNFAAASFFTEYTVVQAIQCVPIPRDIPLTSACLIGCGVLTGVGSVWNRANVQRGQTAAVFGVGGVGLNVIQALRIAGASRIVAVDTVASKEQLARSFGATDFVDASTGDVVGAVRRLLPFDHERVEGTFGAGGVDWAFECVGNPAVLRAAIDVLDWGGTAMAVGVPARRATVEVPITFFTHVDRNLVGCRAGSEQPHKDVPLIIDMYRRGVLKLDELVSATYPLERFDDAVQDLHAGRLARGVLTIG
ncbi:MAG: Zn-dependent alcohol dehydrogenase [Acidimicrobiia bacterium]